MSDYAGLPAEAPGSSRVGYALLTVGCVIALLIALYFLIWGFVMPELIGWFIDS